MDESSVRVILRTFDQPLDQAFIYASWRNGAFYGVPRGTKEDAKAFFKAKTAEIKQILKNSEVRIACLEDDPATIIGYSVATGTHMHWIFVKSDFRGKGIGNMLFPKIIKTVTDCLSTIGSVIAQKKGLIRLEEPKPKEN